LLSHSPELKPAERLWLIINATIANRSFEGLDELEDVLIHWWPDVDPCHQ
jgi:hypothetical protein